jgi:chemosensory pili system protein ChpA (sensor histidine kinase/response regulator)
MTAPDEFDLGPLTWVKGEIEQALSRATEAITAYAGNPLDSTQLKFCKTHLHQAHGALEIVGLDGVTRLTDECENLIDALESGSVAMSTAIAANLAAAFKALTAYLDDLVEGAPHQPVRLYPAYRDVMAARGADRILESDLFFPDLSPRPPRREPQEVPADIIAYVAAQRRRFQAGLLRWLRNAADNAALREMTEAVRAIERTQAMPQHRAFWWVTIGFTETLVAVGAQAGLEAKRLCARIDLQMKRLMEGSQSVAERLLRDTLYFVARSRVQSAQVQEIRRVYALERAIPSDDEERRDLQRHEGDLRLLREIINAAKDKWNRFSSGQSHELGGFVEQADRLRDSGAALGNPDFSILASAIASVAVHVAEKPANVTESIALELATALLLAEHAVDSFARLSPEFPQQVMAMGSRLSACLAGLVPEVPPPVLDEMSRKAQERMVMAQVVAEIRSNLSTIESVLDGFFRDTGKRGDLPALEGQIRQVSGALSMLGADRAVEALAECRAEITRFAGEDYSANAADFERVARSMSALGFFVEALQHGPAEFDTFMEPVAPRRVRVPDEDTMQMASPQAEVDFLLDGAAEDTSPQVPMASVEDELAVQRRDAQTLYEAWRDKPGDSVLAAELKANLEAIVQDADLVDERGLQESAGRALELLDRSSAPALADIAQAMAGVAPEAPGEDLPAPSDEVRALAQSSDEVVDAELLAIFLEEAHEVLGTIAEQHALSLVEPTNRDILSTIRRGFHTLKGSGRMVGLTRFGEAAWAVEQVMNLWLQESRNANADLHAMIEAARQLFKRWIADLSATGVSGVDGSPLIAACERLRDGQAFDFQATAATEAAVDPMPAELAADSSRENSIVIGDMRMSPSLYGIFVDEAASHLDVMRRELLSLVTEPQPPSEALVRSSHTLAGIAGTVSFRRLHELARAFERAVLVARAGSIVPSRDALTVLTDVVAAIESLVSAVRQLREPPQVEPLEILLEQLRAEWAAASGDMESTTPFEVNEGDDGGVSAPGEAAMGFAPIDTDRGQPRADHVAPGALEGASSVDFDFSSDEPAESAELPAVPPDLMVGRDVAGVSESESAMASDEVAFESAGDEPVPDAALDLEFDAPVDTGHAASAAAFGDVTAPFIANPEPFAGDGRLDTAEAAQSVDFDIDGTLDGDLDLALGDDDPGFDVVGEVSTAEPSAIEPQQPDHVSVDVPPTEAAMPEHLHGDSANVPVTEDVPQAQVSVPEAIAIASVPVAAALAGALLAAPSAPVVEDPAPSPPAADPSNPVGSDSLSAAELLARGFDPSERLLERIKDEIDPQLLPIFLEEAAELVPLLGQQLRFWEAAPADAGSTQGLQRTLHTLKGSARMAGAMAIGQVTHSMESRVESALGMQTIPPAIVDGLVASYDRVNALLDGLRGTATAENAAQSLAASGDAQSVSDVVADATVHASGAETEVPAEVPAFSTEPEAGAMRHAVQAPAAALSDEPKRALLRVRSDLVDRLVNEAGEVAIARSRIEGEMRGLKSGLKDLTESVVRLRNQLREIEIAAESQMQSRQREAEEKHETFDPLEFDRFTRFQEITRMMAESVNDVATVQQSLLKSVDDADLAILAQARMNRDLQGGLMRVRMVPFNNVSERLYRVVRQTAKETGKRANLDISGVQTEIDRSVLERMSGPFEHLVRNAIAHGIEAPADRAAAGKSETGQIHLSARQEGNEFFLAFEDDGRGLDLPKIRARAVAAGLAREDEVLTDSQIADFIFMPGFSTADSISEVAGRGVGMDVVRAEVAALGGRIDIESKPGEGTRFGIALPLTLAVTQVVLVRVGAQMYAIPSVMVEQVRQTRAEELAAAYGRLTINWQDREYPLFYLPRLLGDSKSRAHAQRLSPVLLVRSGTQRAAIHVDELAGNQEVVVKNIGPQLSRVIGVAGATVLGNGRIVLILNPVPLALQKLASGATRIGPEGHAGGEGESRDAERVVPTVMVVDDSLTVRKITSRLLQRENYEVLTARDGVDALEQLQVVRPDILLVDIEMPRMDGFDLTRNVRADAALKHIPIIMITSRTAEKHRKYAMEVGVNMFLGKPYQEEELLDGIASLLRHTESTI